jgi:hypothetical protein
MNISHVWAACYQHVEVSITCRPVRTLLCFDAGIPRFGSQQFKCKKVISDNCWQTGNHPFMICLANQDIRRAIIPLILGAMYWPLEIFTKLVQSAADF